MSLITEIICLKQQKDFPAQTPVNLQEIAEIGLRGGRGWRECVKRGRLLMGIALRSEGSFPPHSCGWEKGAFPPYTRDKVAIFKPLFL